MITLDKRLEMVYNLTEKCDTFADIGSDHGYLPIKLLQDKKIKNAIVSDLNEGPLNNAIKNFETFNLKNKAKFILGDGLNGIDNIDSFAICGMGGELICNILLESINIVRKANFFILQPMNNIELVRKFLHENDFTITKEDIVKDKHNFYIALKVINKKDCNIYDEIFYELGYNLYMDKNELFLDFINYKINVCKKIVKMCKNKNTENAKTKQDEHLLKIKKLEGVKQRYESL